MPEGAIQLTHLVLWPAGICANAVQLGLMIRVVERTKPVPELGRTCPSNGDVDACGVSYATTPWTCDCSPTAAGCASANLNVFRQIGLAGKGWRGYAEGMPSNCDKANNPATSYAVRHNPPPYYTDLGSRSSWDLPMGTTSSGNLLNAVNAGALTAYSSVTPNLLNDMHDGTVARGDSWLAGWIPKITAGPDYQAGNLAIFIVWDENASGSGNNPSHVACFVLSAFTPAATQSATAFTHYSLLRTTEEITGVGLLGQAATATSMRTAFHL